MKDLLESYNLLHYHPVTCDSCEWCDVALPPCATLWYNHHADNDPNHLSYVTIILIMAPYSVEIGAQPEPGDLPAMEGGRGIE